MVRMAQPWSMRYTLVDGQGNFGSVDGDSPAAMRYTECRMEQLANEMMADIKKDTVDMMPTYTNEREEPTVLPARIPNLLINGSNGIAVGMATNMPTHNLREVLDGCIVYIDNTCISSRMWHPPSVMHLLQPVQCWISISNGYIVSISNPFSASASATD